MSEPWQRSVFTVSVDVERGVGYDSKIAIQKAVRGAIRKALPKKKYGEVRSHVAEWGELEQAAFQFARKIREAGEDAVNERLR